MAVLLLMITLLRRCCSNLHCLEQGMRLPFLSLLRPEEPDRPRMVCRHLKSYEHMGMFNVTCSDGCSCEEATVDSWHKAINSQVGDCRGRGYEAANTPSRCSMGATYISATTPAGAAGSRCDQQTHNLSMAVCHIQDQLLS